MGTRQWGLWQSYGRCRRRRHQWDLQILCASISAPLGDRIAWDPWQGAGNTHLGTGRILRNLLLTPKLVSSRVSVDLYRPTDDKGAISDHSGLTSLEL